MAVEITKDLIRNSLRLKNYGYSQVGVYFVTVSTDKKNCYFGNIIDGVMISLPTSEIVRKIWLEIPGKFHNVDLDAFIITPNHIHGIIFITKENKSLIQQMNKDNPTYCLPKDLIYQTNKMNCSNNKRIGLINQTSIKTKDWILMKSSDQTLGKIIRYFKAKSAKIIHDRCFLCFKWQRNYYEHVVRSTKELDGIREYIMNNQLKWALDRENCLSENFNMGLDKYYKDVFKK